MVGVVSLFPELWSCNGHVGGSGAKSCRPSLIIFCRARSCLICLCPWLDFLILSSFVWGIWERNGSRCNRCGIWIVHVAVFGCFGCGIFHRGSYNIHTVMECGYFSVKFYNFTNYRAMMYAVPSVNTMGPVTLTVSFNNRRLDFSVGNLCAVVEMLTF